MLNQMVKKDLLKIKDGCGYDDLSAYFSQFPYEDIMDIMVEVKDDTLKERYYKFVACNYPCAFKCIKDDREMLIAIDALYETSNRTNYGFELLSCMKNPNLVEKEKLKEILKTKKSLTIYDTFGEKLIDCILTVDTHNDYYELLIRREKLSSDTIKRIYSKIISSMDEYEKVKNFLHSNGIRGIFEITKFFIREKSDNAEIANDILESYNYDDEDYEGLILIISMFGTAKIIFWTLMREMNIPKKWQIDMLEKALLQTGDTEYIAYYYYYRKKEAFLANALHFLTYLEMNKDKVGEPGVLNDMTESMMKDEESFVSSIKGKVE